MNGQLQDRYSISCTSTACSFCDRSANVLSVSYTVHIRFVCYTSVTRLVRLLTVLRPLLMRSLRLRRQSSPPLRRLPSPDKHFLHFFCPFGVRYLYPLIFDCTKIDQLPFHDMYFFSQLLANDDIITTSSKKTMNNSSDTFVWNL